MDDDFDETSGPELNADEEALLEEMPSRGPPPLARSRVRRFGDLSTENFTEIAQERMGH